MKPNKRTRVFLVTLDIPEDVYIRDVKDYILNAVKDFCGCLSPENPWFDLDRNSIKVVQQKIRKQS